MESNKNRGFTTLLFAFLLPVVLLILFLFFLFFQLIVLQQKNLHLCRVHLLNSQKSMIQPLEQLLKLNPKATRLILRRNQVLLQLSNPAVFLNPILLAALSLRLKKITAEQTSLALQQKILIERAAATSFYQTSQLMYELNASSSFIKDRQYISVNFNNIHISTPRLAVRKTIPFEKASPYRLERPFATQQKIEARWVMDFKLPLYSKLSKFAGGRHQLEGSCSASLVKKKGKWRATLIRDRH